MIKFRQYTIDWWDRGLEIQFPRSFFYLSFNLTEWVILSFAFDVYAKQIRFGFLCFTYAIQYITSDSELNTEIEFWGNEIGDSQEWN